jgi:hypothetical protein
METNFDRDIMRRLSHTAAEPVGAADETPAASGESVGNAIDRVARALKSARAHFGHGTDNARDEAAELCSSSPASTTNWVRARIPNG